FRQIVNRLAEAGHRVIVFGGTEERGLTAQVAGSDAADLGGRCSLPALAAGLAECRWLLTNDSGPMHLAAAVRTPTVSLWGAGDPHRTGPLGPGHRLLRRTDLPCVPCVRNQCPRRRKGTILAEGARSQRPRRGKGTILAEAERECMALLEVDQVWREITGASRERDSPCLPIILSSRSCVTSCRSTHAPHHRNRSGRNQYCRRLRRRGWQRHPW